MIANLASYVLELDRARRETTFDDARPVLEALFREASLMLATAAIPELGHELGERAREHEAAWREAWFPGAEQTRLWSYWEQLKPLLLARGA